MKIINFGIPVKNGHVDMDVNVANAFMETAYAVLPEDFVPIFTPFILEENEFAINLPMTDVDEDPETWRETLKKAVETNRKIFCLKEESAL
jgi:hypothetical protein